MMFLPDHIIASTSFLKVSFFMARLHFLALLPADTISRTKEGKIQHGPFKHIPLFHGESDFATHSW